MTHESTCNSRIMYSTVVEPQVNKLGFKLTQWVAERVRARIVKDKNMMAAEAEDINVFLYKKKKQPCE